MQQKVLVGTADGLRQLGEDGCVHMAGHEVGALTRDDSGWWAIVDGCEVWRCATDGEWTRAAAVETLRAHCLLPTSQGVLIGTCRRSRGRTNWRVSAICRSVSPRAPA